MVADFQAGQAQTLQQQQHASFQGMCCSAVIEIHADQILTAPCQHAVCAQQQIC